MNYRDYVGLENEFDFSVLTPYEEVCDYFLSDTKGKLPGGNGSTFDWKVLENYPSTKPFFLSGGIGINESLSSLQTSSPVQTWACAQTAPHPCTPP